MVRDFQKNGYIVLASVSSGEAADDLERDTKGYVRALVLDAEEVRILLYSWGIITDKSYPQGWFHTPFPEISQCDALAALPHNSPRRSISTNDRITKRIVSSCSICHLILVSR